MKYPKIYERVEKRIDAYTKARARAQTPEDQKVVDEGFKKAIYLMVEIFVEQYVSWALNGIKEVLTAGDEAQPKEIKEETNEKSDDRSDGGGGGDDDAALRAVDECFGRGSQRSR